MSKTFNFLHSLFIFSNKPLVEDFSCKILNKDFVIEFTPIFFEKNQETQEMFMYHELLHIEKDNESIRHHDYEEFKEILDKYGDKYYKELSLAFKEHELKELEKAKEEIDENLNS